MAPVPRRRHRTRLALGLVSAVLVGACGGSGFQYVKNAEHGVYFKLDEDWVLYDENQYFAQPALELSPLERRRRVATNWVRAFDASPKPSLDNVFDTDAPAPHGVARIQLLSEAERESVDLSMLRSAYLTFDPVKAKRENPRGPVEIISEEDMSLESGHHGVRMVVAFDTMSGDIGVIDQTTLVDGANRVLYLFVVGCSRQCYAEHQDQIDVVADSWTIEGGAT